MKKPSFYITIALRYLFYIQTPVTLLLAILGIAWSSNQNKTTSSTFIIFTSIPFLYYLAFANINRPHDYYSLILVPFVAIVAAGGLQFLAESLKIHFQKSSTLILTGTISILFLSNCFIYFCNYWLTPNTSNRYEEIQKETEQILAPFQFSLVYVDTSGDFSLNEYLGESRRDIVSAKRGTLDVSKLRNEIKPIWAPCVLFAMNHQYGQMHWFKQSLSINHVKEQMASFGGHLSYLIIYMANDPIHIKNQLRELKIKQIASTEDFIIYEVLQTRN